jgi:L-threonylcarbamoyladenylate synthase
MIRSEYTAADANQVRSAFACAATAGDNKAVKKTLRLTVNAQDLESAEAKQALERCAEILRTGGLVALPTETVYGLGANALDPEAVESIFRAKERPAWDPVIVHIADCDAGQRMLEGLVADIPERARKLMHAFWPGPLTLLLPRSRAVPDAVTAGRPLVGVRMPAHPVALALIRRAGVPVAAPSANVFGHTSPTTADHVLEDLDGRIDAVLDAGPTSHGVESTVLDPGQDPMVIYRPGAVTADQTRDVAGAVEMYQTGQVSAALPGEALPSPGVGLRHYAPRARLHLVEAPPAELARRLAEMAKLLEGERVGMLLPAELQARLPGVNVFPWGSWSAPEELARNLYAGLRSLDALGCSVILCPMPPAEGLGAAIRDRLLKAAQPAK